MPPRRLDPLRVAVVVATLACAAAAQRPLPSELGAIDIAWPDAWATALRLPLSQDVGFMQAAVTFCNDPATTHPAGDRVSLHWTAKAPDAYDDKASQTVSVSFRPTAVVRAAATTTTLYVAGWNDDPGVAVVEAWHVNPPSSLATTTSEAGEPLTVVPRPSLRRHVVKLYTPADTPDPIRAMACHADAGALVLLAHGRQELLRLDITSGQTESLGLDPTTHPCLAAARSLRAGRLRDAHGGALLISAWPDPPWGITPHPTTEPDRPVLVLRDDDGDGDFDEVETRTDSSFDAAYPISHWRKQGAP